MLTAQLDLFATTPAMPPAAAAAASRPDAVAQRARAELSPGAWLGRPAAGHRTPNLQFFGIRGHWLSLCPMPLRAQFRPAYLNTTTEPSPCNSIHRPDWAT